MKKVMVSAQKRRRARGPIYGQKDDGIQKDKIKVKLSREKLGQFRRPCLSFITTREINELLR